MIPGDSSAGRFQRGQGAPLAPAAPPWAGGAPGGAEFPGKRRWLEWDQPGPHPKITPGIPSLGKIQLHPLDIIPTSSPIFWCLSALLAQFIRPFFPEQFQLPGSLCSFKIPPKFGSPGFLNCCSEPWKQVGSGIGINALHGAIPMFQLQLGIPGR